MNKILIAYVPVLHAGYKKFIKKYSDLQEIYIFGKDIISQFDYLSKEIRALDPKDVKKALKSWGLENVKILTEKRLIKLASKSPKNIRFIFPDEDVCIKLAEKYFSKFEIVYDDVFLRWDKHKATEKKSVEVEQEVSLDEFNKKLMLEAFKQAEKSSDWWRHVGAVLVKSNKVLLSANNKHVPSQHTPYVNGDPRNSFHKGIHVELSTAIHAEAFLISQAARKGISLEGASIYVSTFPCPPCAKLIAYSGIKKLYYGGGYGVLDGESILKQQGVEIIFVDTK
jgi:dCMP deaminase